MTNTRTPEQEAAIDAAISRLDNLLSQRRALRVGRGTRIDDAIHSAVVGAALAIVAEPQGKVPSINDGLAELDDSRRMRVTHIRRQISEGQGWPS